MATLLLVPHRCWYPVSPVDCFSFHFYLISNSEYLHVPEEVVPNTLKRQAPRARPAGPTGEQKPREGGDRDSYRRGGEGAEKKTGAEGDFKPNFV